VIHGATSLSINLPALVLPEQSDASRLVHVHRNTPGVLAAINAVFAAEQVNIDAQILGTRGEIGYVITDIGSAPGPQVIAALEHLPETIRLRKLH
jgi:D-3-phosphoglycerate dehydrogenase / 2-oxoglutarate reductase